MSRSSIALLVSPKTPGVRVRYEDPGEPGSLSVAPESGVRGPKTHMNVYWFAARIVAVKQK